jgi:hypothetical protein
MKAQGFGLKDWSLIRKRTYEIGGFAFVDDTDLIHANPDPTVTNEELIEEAQQALNTWHGLIRATGGDLAPEKSYWYLIDLHWKNGRLSRNILLAGMLFWWPTIPVRPGFRRNPVYSGVFRQFRARIYQDCLNLTDSGGIPP